MKKLLLLMSLVAGSVTPTDSVFSAEVIENETYIVAPNAPPANVTEVVPMSPSPGLAWRPGHWFWENGNWRWARGHWASPPHPAAEWIPGHWVSRPHGWVWIPGHWR